MAVTTSEPSLKPKKKKKWLWIVGGIVVLLIIIGSLGGGSDSDNKNEQSESTTSESLNYEIMDRWDIPNGGEGKVVVIPTSYLTQETMAKLGDKFKEDTKSDRNAFIFVFDDKKAAEMRNGILADPEIKKYSQQDHDYYSQHFVGTYTRNINSGFHSFAVYYDGVMGTNHQEIKY